LTALTTQSTTGLVGVTSYDMSNHLCIDRLRYMQNEAIFSYHNIFASKSSSSSLSSRVHRSSLRYFQPPSARTTTILPCSMLDAMRKAACSDAPQDGPAKMPS